MPTTLIFGGSGKVARHLTRHLASPENNHTVYSIIRNSAQTPDIQALGGTPIVQSIEDSSVDDIARTIAACAPDAVVWAAGAGGKGGAERTRAVDQEGAIRSFDACAKAGVKRYIMVSAIDIRDRENRPEPEWYNGADRARSDQVWSAIGHYCRAKLAADRELVVGNERRGLDWTIVRPTGLGEGKETGRVAMGRVHLDAVVDRADVAGVVVECLRNEGTKGLAVDVVGGETLIREAVEEVVRGRIDGFEGRY